MNRGVIAAVRDMVPIRPLTRLEALHVAERQAYRFLKLVGITEPAVPEHAITELPRLQVARLRPFPHSGATQWSSGRWLVILNAAESPARQRFSLAHEFKHILDHRFIDIIYDGVPACDRGAWAEQVCHYFAGCLLMPRPWLKRAYFGGTRATADLAALFDVSPSAMAVRLNQIGLTEPKPRCDRMGNRVALRGVTGAGSPAQYHRQAAPVPI